jgi:hypothetical protein
MNLVKVVPSETIEVISNGRKDSQPNSSELEDKSHKDLKNVNALEESKVNIMKKTLPGLKDSVPQESFRMDKNEQELEALIYEDKLITNNNDSLEDGYVDEEEDENDDLEEQKLPHVGQNKMNKEYSKTFVRQVSMLKNQRMKKNKIYKMDTYIRDASNGLSYSRMQQRVERAHPRRIVNGNLEKYPIFGTRTGWHLPSKEWRHSDLKELGVGISLYFKFLKYLM